MKLVSIPANPVPEGAVVAELRTPDGVSLRAAHWPPPPGRKGTVCLFQGRTECIEKYFEVVRDLRARGFAVAALDWRGQGLSQRALKDPFKGHLNSFSEYDTDLATFMQQMVLPDCPPPYFAIGHSTGGSVLLRAAHGGQRWFERIVLSAPLIRLAQVQMLGFAGPLARAMHLLGFGRLYVPGGGPEIGALQPFLGNPVTVPPDYTIEETAEILLRNKISGAPVMDEAGKLVGTITQTDLFKALVSLTGLTKRGITFGFLLEDRPGSIKEVADIIREYGGRMASILSSSEQVAEGLRKVYVRMYQIDRNKLKELLVDLKAKANVLYMVDHRENKREIYG